MEDFLNDFQKDFKKMKRRVKNLLKLASLECKLIELKRKEDKISEKKYLKKENKILKQIKLIGEGK